MRFGETNDDSVNTNITFNSDSSNKLHLEFFGTGFKPDIRREEPTSIDFAKNDIVAQAKCGSSDSGDRQVKCFTPPTRELPRGTFQPLDPAQVELTEMAHKLFARDLERNIFSGNLLDLRRNLELLEGNPKLATKLTGLLKERLAQHGIRIEVEDKHDGIGNVVTLKLSRNNNDTKSSGATFFEINSNGIIRGETQKYFMATPEKIGAKDALNHILRGSSSSR